jgi:hypothetical protein
MTTEPRPGLAPFDVACPARVWQVRDALADLAFRGALPGASGYDHAAHQLRVLQARGAGVNELLPLVLPTSWMVNAKATSVTFKTWLSPPFVEVWSELALLLPVDAAPETWRDQPMEARDDVLALVRALTTPPGASLAAVTKVLALLRPQLVPLMDDAALWFVLGLGDEPTTADAPSAPADAFLPMLDWFCEAAARHESDLVALARAHQEHVYDAPQVLDRLLWMASWGHRHRRPTQPTGA